MNKPTKIVVIMMITTIIIYTVIGIYRTNNSDLSNNSSGDILNSGENTDVSNAEKNKISYEITSGDDEVVLRGTSEGIISITTYKFENNKLISITLSEEITSGDDNMVEKIYNHMKTDEDMSMVYSSIEKDGKVITATLRDEYVDSYGESDKKDIYDELINSLKISE